MTPSINVIICTHNPRREYLDEVLSALKLQTLPLHQWELLIIDNASSTPLLSEINITWHPNARIIYEERLGLTYARLRAIQETSGEVLIFVDDDNVLAEDYIEVALQIAEDWPILGAWGGQCIARFEEEPPPWTKPYWESLTIREFKDNRWANFIGIWDATPAGAGMCVRRSVADAYFNLLCRDSIRISIGRRGDLLLSSEDVDLAYTACDIGLGTGLFTSLKLYHLIAPYRLKEDYLLKIAEGVSYSATILDSFRGSYPKITSLYRLRLLISWFFHPRVWFMKPRSRRFLFAKYRGKLLAMKDLSKGK